MQLNFTIPLSIKVTSYHSGVPAYTKGSPDNWEPGEPPEIEFEVHTLTGRELSESDFGSDTWDDLTCLVLQTHQNEAEDLRADAAIEAEIYRREQYYE